MKTIAVVPLSNSGFWLNATSSPSPTDTEGTALGMKNSSPSAGDERQQAGDESSDEAGVDSVARRAASRVPIVLPGEACRQYAIPLLGEARQNDHDERRDEDHSENQRGEAPDKGSARQRPDQHD